jgi:hypothetical protein
MEYDVKYNIVNFRNVGFLNAQFTDEQLKPIKDEIQKIQSNFSLATEANSILAGHIKHEYHLTDSLSHLEQLFSPLIHAYDSTFDYNKEFNILSKNVPIYLDSAWVNFQQKHEFNPPHNHSGIYSFALWIKIPYSYKNEKAMFPKLGHNTINSTGSFNFQYVNALGKISTYTITLDTTSENCAVFFPAEMVHDVNPFYTSDDYRISVSGNFKFKTA